MQNIWVAGDMQKIYTYCSLGKKCMLQSAVNKVEMGWTEEEVNAAIADELKAIDAGDENKQGYLRRMLRMMRVYHTDWGRTG